MEVRNSTSSTRHVELYPGAASIEANAFTIADGRTGNELTSWITLEQTGIELEPGAKKRIGVSVAVPAIASKGERYATIWAQIGSSAGQGNINQVHRVGIRMYLDVGPGGEPPTDFRIDGLIVGPGPGEWSVVTATVTNTGARTLDMTGDLSLSKGAVRAGPFKVVNSPSIQPGQTGQVQVEIDQALPDGTWTVKLTLASGVVQHSADAKITLPVVKPVPAAAGTPAWLVWAVSGGAALIMLIVLLVWWMARRAPST